MADSTSIPIVALASLLKPPGGESDEEEVSGTKIHTLHAVDAPITAHRAHELAVGSGRGLLKLAKCVIRP